MRRELQGVDWKAELDDKSTGDAWVFIDSTIDDVIKKNNPRKIKIVANVKQTPLWLNKSIINKLMKKKQSHLLLLRP